MTATTVETVWRWRRHKKGFHYVETTPPDSNVNWITEQHVYSQLGMVTPK